jgi:hypothetical protein
VPNLIPTEILLNDRWGLNLTLAIIDDVLCCKSNLNSEDLVLVNKYQEIKFVLSSSFLRLMKCRYVHLCVISFLYFSNIDKMSSRFNDRYVTEENLVELI